MDETFTKNQITPSSSSFVYDIKKSFGEPVEANDWDSSSSSSSELSAKNNMSTCSLDIPAEKKDSQNFDSDELKTPTQNSVSASKDSLDWSPALEEITDSNKSLNQVSWGAPNSQNNISTTAFHSFGSSDQVSEKGMFIKTPEKLNTTTIASVKHDEPANQASLDIDEMLSLLSKDESKTNQQKNPLKKHPP